MKYRVIKDMDAEGQTWFFPQYKKLFRWRFFIRRSAPIELAKMGDFDKRTKFFKVEDAFAFIDKKPLQNLVVKREEYEVQKGASSD